MESRKIYETIYKKTRRGRMKISKSKIEQECEDILRSIVEIENVKTQVRLPLGGRCRYDFSFESKNTKYILELDGEQHFTYSSYIHRKKAAFSKGRTIDVKKTLLALFHGYCVIRIDSKSMRNLQEIIKECVECVNENNVLFLYPRVRYEWFCKTKLRKKWLQKYATLL